MIIVRLLTDADAALDGSTWPEACARWRWRLSGKAHAASAAKCTPAPTSTALRLIKKSAQ